VSRHGFEVSYIQHLFRLPLIGYSPYKFEAPWTSWEFAHHILHKEANLVIISMAWLTREEPRSYSRTPKDPDMDTLAYWLARLEPIIREETEGEIIVVLANRTGTEEEAVYAGTSCVLGIHGGEVKVYGVLGRGERELLIVDTNKPPQAKLVSEPNTTASNVSEAITENSTFTKNSESSALTVDTAFTPPILGHDEEYAGMTDLLTPISPADPVSPNAYFMKFPRPRPENAQESLRSSIAEPKFGSTLPGSPTFRRPESPKSRNASRTRQAEEQKPALISHDLAVEEEPSPRPVSVRSPPISASARPPRTDVIAENGLHGSRSRSSSNHASPRPKSTLW
jgi:protein N-terminal amidase